MTTKTLEVQKLVMANGVPFGERSPLSRLVKLDVNAPGIQVAQFRDPELEHVYRNSDLAGIAKVALKRHAEMAFLQYSEQAILNGLFGNCCGCVRTTITAGSTAQTTINTGSIATGGVSGNMDQTPNTTATIWIGKPGTTTAQNQYTNPHSFLLTGSAATSLTIASQSIGLAVTVGDFIFLQGSASAGGATTNAGPMMTLNTLYIGLSTAAYTAGQATIIAAEPTATGSYARIVVPNNQASFPIATAASPSVLTAGGPFSFAASTAAWSTGATNLVTMFIADATGPLGSGGNLIATGTLTTPQAVNASGITLSFASSSITLTLT